MAGAWKPEKIIEGGPKAKIADAKKNIIAPKAGATTPVDQSDMVMRVTANVNPTEKLKLEYIGLKNRTTLSKQALIKTRLLSFKKLIIFSNQLS